MGRPHPRELPQWPSCVEAVVPGSLGPVSSLGRATGRPQHTHGRRKVTAVARAAPGNAYSRCLALAEAGGTVCRNRGPRAPTRRLGCTPRSFLGPAAPPAAQAWTLAHGAEVETPSLPCASFARTHDPGEQWQHTGQWECSRNGSSSGDSKLGKPQHKVSGQQ